MTIVIASALPQRNTFAGNGRQQPSWNGNWNDNQQWPNWDNNQFPTSTQAQTTSTTPATVATAKSPAYLRCTREECLVTNEYNPVCGSDNNNYGNIRKLDCANQCGQRYISNWQGNWHVWMYFEKKIKLIWLFFSFALFLCVEVTMLRRGACMSGGRVA